MRCFQCAALDKWSSLLFDAPCFDLSGYNFSFFFFLFWSLIFLLTGVPLSSSCLLPPTLTCHSTAKQCALWISVPYTDFPGYPLVMCIVVSCAIFSPAIDVHYSFRVPCSDSRKHHWSMRHTLTYEGTPNEVHRVVICCTPTCKDTTGCCEFGMG